MLNLQDNQNRTQLITDLCSEFNIYVNSKLNILPDWDEDRALEHIYYWVRKKAYSEQQQLIGPGAKTFNKMTRFDRLSLIGQVFILVRQNHYSRY